MGGDKLSGGGKSKSWEATIGLVLESRTRGKGENKECRTRQNVARGKKG